MNYWLRISLLSFGVFISSHYAQAIEICETPSAPGVWDLADNATIDIPIGFDVGDVATSAYSADSVKVDITHTYAGDLGGRLISPDNTNIHLWQLGDGNTAPSTPTASSCGRGGYDFELRDSGGGVNLIQANEGTYCVGANDDSLISGGGGISDPYVFARTNPSDIGIRGVATPIDALSSFVGDSVVGNWNVRISDDYANDEGTINEVCLDLGFAGVDHEFFVSTNATCNDRLESAVINNGDIFYICQNVANKGTETFEVKIGDTNNDLGVDLTSLEGNYAVRDSSGDLKTVINSFTAGTGIFPLGSHTFNSGVIVTGTDTNFTAANTLSPSQTISVTINGGPSFSSSANPSFLERESGLVVDVNVSDDSDNEGNGIIYNLNGGLDDSLFNLDATTGEVSFLSSPDYGSPADSGGDNAYDIKVQACDSNNFCVTQDIVIDVTAGVILPGGEIGTYDTYHIIPPFYSRTDLNTTSNTQHHYVYLSTTEVTPFDVTIQNADGVNGAVGGVTQVVSVSKSSPTLVTLSGGVYGGIGHAALGIVDDSQLNTPDTSEGLILTGSKRFYANVRHSSGSQGTSLTAKGQTAFGERFRSGHLHTNDNESGVKSHFISVMATKDGTTINFSDITPGITFVGVSGEPTSLSPVFLNKYESYTIGVRLDQGNNTSGTTANDLNGTLITSDKPIVMNSGSFLAGAQASGRDIGSDQVLPTAYTGTKFIVVEGGGGSAAATLETPIVIADQDGTEIFLKGSATPYDLGEGNTVLNAGEYAIIPGTEYPSAGAMFIRTSKPSYVYQSTSSNSSNGNGMNYVAPIFDNLEVQPVLIPDVGQLGAPIISVIAPVTATIMLDGAIMTGATAVPGIGAFVLYTDTDESGDVEITGDEPFLVTTTSAAGARGAAGYFVGFPNSYAVRDNPTTPPGQPVIIDVKANDIVGPFVFDVVSITQPTNGISVLNSDDTITYTPNSAAFTGVDSFNYTIDNGNGLADITIVEVSIDSDGDGVGNTTDLDSDNDGIPNGIEGSVDSDGDTIIDSLDLDSDNDGIFDLIEAGHSELDNDNDGRLDGFAGDNGLADVVETVAESGVLDYSVGNFDGDLVANYIDLDSDNDGIPDNIEAQAPLASFVAPTLSYNNNGVDLAYTTGLIPFNTMSSGNPDYLNTDSDGMAPNDTAEAGLNLLGTVGNNGLDNDYEAVDDYSDPNGIFPFNLPDGDVDGIPDYQDNNVPPTDLSIEGENSITVDENLAVGTSIGTLSTVDADDGDTFTYTVSCVSSGADDSLFSLTGNILETGSILDFETPTDNDEDGIYEICIVSNDGLHAYEETLTLSVNDLDEIPPAAPTVNLYREGDGPIIGTAEIASVITLTTDNPNGPNVLCLNSPIIANENGDWNCSNPTPLPIWGDSLIAVSTDAANNSSTGTNFEILPADSTPPTPPVIDPFTEGNSSITGLVEPGTTISIVGISCAANPILSTDAGIWSCDNPTNAPSHGDTISATVTDAAANTSGEGMITVIGVGEIHPPTIMAIASASTKIIGTANAGVTINLTTTGVGGPNLTCGNDPVVADYNGEWECLSPTPVPAINNIISAVATINSIDSAQVSTTVFETSSSSPSAPDVSPTDGNPVLGSTIPGGVIDVIDVLTGIILCSVTASSDGDFTCGPLNPAATDNQILAITVSDLNTNSTSNPSIETVDQSDPSEPVITFPNANTDVSNPTMVMGTCETGTTVNVSNVNLIVNPTTGPCEAGDFSIDVIWDSEAHGNSEIIQVNQTDSAGNNSENAQLTLGVDLVSPLDPILNFPISEGRTDGTVSGVEGEPGTTVTVSSSPGGESCTTVIESNGTWSCDLDPTPNEGAVILSSVITDSAENVSNTTITNAIIDTTPPSSPLVDFPINDSTTDGTVSGSGGNYGNEIVVTVQGTSETCSTVVAANGSWTCELVGTPVEGPIEIEVTARDIAGNISIPGTTVLALIDTTPPTAPTINSHNDNDPDNNVTTLAGSCEVGAAVKVFSLNTIPNSIEGICTVTGSYNINITWAAVADATTQSLSVNQTDVAGNTSEESATVDIDVDLTPPTAPTINSHNDNDPDNNPTTLEGACEAGSSVSISNQNLVTTPVVSVCTGEVYSSDLMWNIGADGSTQSLSVKQKDLAGNISNESSVDINVDITLPSLNGNITEEVGDDSATISWNTDEISSSDVEYGLVLITDQSIGEQDVEQRVLNHSITLSDLLSCTTYHYAVISRDAAGNELIEDGYSFDTTGCVGGEPVQIRQITSVIPSVGGGLVELVTPWAESLELSIPNGYNSSHGSCSDGAFFQASKMGESPVIGALGIPEKTDNAIGVYELSAYCHPLERVTSFDQPIRVKITYDKDKAKFYDESSFKIYRYNKNSSGWESLNGCVVDEENKEVSCDTTNFSTFGIFGSFAASGGGGARINSIIGVCNSEKKMCENRFPAPDFSSSDDQPYLDYEKCINTLSSPRHTCAVSWAVAKGLSVCSSSVECGLNIFAKKPHASAPVIKITEKKLTDDVSKLYPNSVIKEVPGSCRAITFKRYPSRRGAGVSSDKFTDVDSFHASYKPLIDLAEQRIVEGDGDTGFARLNEPISRSETVKIFTIARQDTLKLDECLERSKFSDVVENDWFHNFVQNMEANNIVHGYEDGYYRPAKIIVKAEIYKITAISFGYITKTEAIAQALANGELWYEPYEKLVESRLNLSDVITKSSLSQPMTRGEVFEILSKALELKDK